MFRKNTLRALVACGLAGCAPLAQASLATMIPDASLGTLAVNAQSGYSVANVGDLNGDGFQDAAVGIYGYANGEANEGAVLIYFGAATGVDGIIDAVLEVNQADARFGAAVASAGDVNGDGFDDLVVGAPFFDGANTNEGRAFIFFGGAGAFNTVPDANLILSQGSAFFGVSVAGAGDVNGDGYADVLVGSNGYDGAATNTGAALLYFGGPGTFNAVADAQLESANPGVRFGSAVTGAGDVNGDGFADIVIGSPFYANGQTDEGAAFLYFGGAGAFNNGTDAHFEANQAAAEFGSAVAAAGDVNGDGFSDVLVGAARFDNGQVDEGAGFVFFGGSTVNNVVDASFENNQAGSATGTAVAPVGDINADGYADLGVGAPLFDNGANVDSGRVAIHLGSATGPQASAYRQIDLGATTPARLGFALGGGDFNGDGFADVIVGAPDFTATHANQGRAIIYHGGSVADDGVVDGRANSGQASGQLGHSVATGDVNGDGYADLVTGAFGYDGGNTNSGRVSVYFGGAGGFNTTADAQIDGAQADMRLGASVAVGDVNGDGYGDVIAGAPDHNGGSVLEGAVFIYFGGPGAFNTQSDALLEANQANASFGASVAWAGDVNGDGLGDVLVGAPNHDNPVADEGTVYLYFGGFGGFNPIHDASMSGGQASAFLGWRVAGAGDLNGDGFADIAAGGIGFDSTGGTNAGYARVFFGGSTFNTAVDAQIDGTQGDGRFGSAIACAGDTNGDGFSDLIVGAYEFDNGQLNEGRAYIYRGSAGAFSTTAHATLEVDQIESGFGSAVAGAGDVNGDGFADVLVGAPEYDVTAANNEGAAFLYLGSAGAFGTTHAVRMSIAQASTRQGFAVALADVNGDGFADPMVGAPSHDGGAAADEGAASVYLSNGIGKPVAVEQLSAAAAGPVDHWGLSQDPNGFAVAMSVFAGQSRERAKLELEACPPASAFGSPGCTRFVSSNWVDTGATANGAVIARTATGLTLRILYHWRARALLAPFTVTQPNITPAPNPRHGPWRRVRGNSDLGDVRILEVMYRDGFE